MHGEIPRVEFIVSNPVQIALLYRRIEETARAAAFKLLFVEVAATVIAPINFCVRTYCYANKEPAPAPGPAPAPSYLPLSVLLS